MVKFEKKIILAHFRYVSWVLTILWYPLTFFFAYIIFFSLFFSFPPRWEIEPKVTEVVCMNDAHKMRLKYNV